MSQNLFDRSHAYDQMLNLGIRLSGEDKYFFIRGRIRDLKAHLPAEFCPQRILDYGCGIGDSAPFLLEAFPGAQIVGVDTSESALALARQRYASPIYNFCSVQSLRNIEGFDLCYVNGVFHHIPPAERIRVLKTLHQVIKPGGYLALFENNPWNIMMRISMNRIPFDRGVRMISPPGLKRLIISAGLTPCLPTRFLFYFPHFLAFLRFLEPHLARLPLGAQYYILAMKTP